MTLNLDQLPADILSRITCELSSYTDRLSLNACNRSLRKSTYQWPDVDHLWVISKASLGMLQQFARLNKLKQLCFDGMQLRSEYFGPLDEMDFDGMIRFLGRTVEDLAISETQMDLEYVAAFLGMPKLRRLKMDFGYLLKSDICRMRLHRSGIEELELNIRTLDKNFEQFCKWPNNLHSLQLNVRLRVEGVRHLSDLPLSLHRLTIRLPRVFRCGRDDQLLNANFAYLNNLTELSFSQCVKPGCYKFPEFVKALKGFVKENLPDSVRLLRLTDGRHERSLMSYIRERGHHEAVPAPTEPLEFTGPFPDNRLQFLQATADIAWNRPQPLFIEIHHSNKELFDCVNGDAVTLNVNEKLQILILRMLALA